MEIHDKVRVMREVNQWSQEEMAEKMGMSVTGYAKIERGQTKLHIDKLQQIAQIFNIDLIELLTSQEKSTIWFFGENSGDNTANYYSNAESQFEIEKLKLVIEHKDNLLQQKNEIISQKDNEILALKEIIALLKQQ